MSAQFDPYSYIASTARTSPAPAPFDPYAYLATNATKANPNYSAPDIGSETTWSAALKDAPQSAAAGVTAAGADLLGLPMDFANNVANLGRAAIGYAESKITGRAPSQAFNPVSPVNVPGSSEWIKSQIAQRLGPQYIQTQNPTSYLDQSLAVGSETAAPFLATPAVDGDMATAVGRNTVDNPQSISAAAASPSMTAVSPELREAVERATVNGERIDPEILGRHIQAETLPVPARLTKGQATQDPVLLSMEQNQRGAYGAFARHFDAQNKNLAENMQAMRDAVGPDVNTTNQVDHGQALIDSYLANAKEADATIAKKYHALRAANGGEFPVGPKTLLQNVSNALHKNLLFEHAPSPEMRQLQNLADKGSMTLEQFEAMRTNLARIMRSNADGNEKAAAGIIRSEMENLPLTPRTAQVKALADSARAAAKAQFDVVDADPAYKAAINGTVPPDRFVNRFIVNGNRDDVETMRQNLAHDERATQTMGVAALEHLRQSARLDDLYRGNFASQSFNKAFGALRPKLNSLFTPRQIEDLSNIGDVARYETAQPRGSFVNNSNTAVSQFAEHAKGAAEGIVNSKTLGFGGTLARKLLKGASERRLFQEHIAPGAGISTPVRGTE